MWTGNITTFIAYKFVSSTKYPKFVIFIIFFLRRKANMEFTEMWHSSGHGLTLLWQIMGELNIVLSDLLLYVNTQLVIVIIIKVNKQQFNLFWLSFL